MRSNCVRLISVISLIAILAIAVSFAVLPCLCYAEEETVCVSINSYGKVSVFDKAVGDKFIPDIPEVPSGYAFCGWSDGKKTYGSDEAIEITSQFIEHGLTLTAIYQPLEKDYTLYYIIGGAGGGLLLILLIIVCIVIKKKRHSK